MYSNNYHAVCNNIPESEIVMSDRGYTVEVFNNYFDVVRWVSIEHSDIKYQKYCYIQSPSFAMNQTAHCHFLKSIDGKCNLKINIKLNSRDNVAFHKIEIHLSGDEEENSYFVTSVDGKDKTKQNIGDSVRIQMDDFQVNVIAVGRKILIDYGEKEYG
ncbi:MAG: hypothetical protein KZQ94_18395 [Candidatus Thiodiazotropha sp. (ex Troendleina suluensis)]|nr:hypothetical protein [Candidatus Thiodiazotropha sp. (ex Troendleina suluensis)]